MYGSCDWGLWKLIVEDWDGGLQVWNERGNRLIFLIQVKLIWGNEDGSAVL